MLRFLDQTASRLALWIFTALGFPLAILYSIPFANIAQLTAIEGGTQQGLCTGVLNISIVIPQLNVALGIGPCDAIFGKGNMLGFTLAAVLSVVGGFVGLALLPRLRTH